MWSAFLLPMNPWLETWPAIQSLDNCSTSSVLAAKHIKQEMFAQEQRVLKQILDTQWVIGSIDGVRCVTGFAWTLGNCLFFCFESRWLKCEKPCSLMADRRPPFCRGVQAQSSQEVSCESWSWNPSSDICVEVEAWVLVASLNWFRTGSFKLQKMSGPN